ncbi:TetR family transcriptional regulator [Erwinia pyrifoliae]|uniref:TetR family transcriptional regulator n=1 Tax=Erwinia pyrifoliae TaxID=79967 RepID=A0ABY5XCE9_ERWPY|nr:TetR family transcriptional regulator [Erwinia pyrifoliae]AUX73023.1 TetR family transcriptional regulator [Erwinia pyrifoliae]MCT2386857.1 TetR family transcriptional regulator [Erwinia pyrifoliae]MCU8587544.1 TetR family transcriptional regulator [Erwinia pyrifoliae]UWS31390.1 TetR family transcriptional regulator [Erwinia pyrifoliae]UWS34805.1 TetR family transcriptional regulator [Erwinia pyrifoliae]
MLIPAKRKNDPEGLKKRILASALKTFAEYGLTGARMEQIAAHAQTTKRMVVYHFNNKERLYIAVLHLVYQEMRQHEAGLNLSAMTPSQAIARLAESSFDYHVTHPDFIRLICSENLIRGRYITQSDAFKTLNQSALQVLEEILVRGKQSGEFDPRIATVDVHRLISSICTHCVANRYTFHTLFANNESEQQILARNRQLVIDATLRYLRPVEYVVQKNEPGGF